MITKREQLIRAFKDTIAIANGKFLLWETRRARKNTKVYKENFCAEIYPRDAEQHFGKTKVSVEKNTTFAAAKKYCKEGHVAVLNFANPIRPGGGVQNGAMAQEECLCRSSNLYCCLTDNTVYKEYYQYNKSLHSYYSSDRIVYSKDVTVFKDDRVIPILMEQKDWFQVDVITCAAPYLGKSRGIDISILKRLLKRRISNIIEVAIDNDIDVLILGAFGCGAFKNPPEVVANAFYDVLTGTPEYLIWFDKIIFAIKDTVKNNGHERNSNYLIFKRKFKRL